MFTYITSIPSFLWPSSSPSSSKSLLVSESSSVPLSEKTSQLINSVDLKQDPESVKDLDKSNVSNEPIETQVKQSFDNIFKKRIESLNDFVPEHKKILAETKAKQKRSLEKYREKKESKVG